jgi:hypothetical protein
MNLPPKMLADPPPFAQPNTPEEPPVLLVLRAQTAELGPVPPVVATTPNPFVLDPYTP